MKGYNFDRRKPYLEDILIPILVFPVLIAFAIAFGFGGAYLAYYIYLFQINVLGNETMILLSPGTFSDNFGSFFVLLGGILLISFTLGGMKKKSAAYIGTLMVWLICTAYTLFSYTVFNDETIFVRSPLNPLGKTYKYHEVKEVSAYDTLNLLSKHSRNRISHYDLVMKDGRRINLIARKPSVKRKTDIQGIRKIEGKINDVLHFVKRDFYYSILGTETSGLFRSFTLVD